MSEELNHPSVEPAQLSPQKQLAVQMIASGMPKSVVAEESNITRRQLYNWEQSPEFQDALHSLLSDAEASTRLKLRSLADNAVGVLTQLMNDEHAPAHVRAGIAYKVLDLVFQQGIAPLPKGGVMGNPKHINPETLRIIRRDVYGLVDPPEAHSPQEKGLSPRLAQEIYCKVLGIPSGTPPEAED